MTAVFPNQIPMIDAYAEKELHIPTNVLMSRAGEAVAKCVMGFCIQDGGKVVIFCGGGNNGGDGYAAGKILLEHGYQVCAVDVFSSGQRTQEGEEALDAFSKTSGAVIIKGIEKAEELVREADCVIEAIFGSGARADYPIEVEKLLQIFSVARAEIQSNKRRKIFFVSVDCPVGVDAYFGTARQDAFVFDGTVELSFSKLGLHSYPARRYVGEVFLLNLGLPLDDIIENFNLQNKIMDREEARKILPCREREGHKGTFGTLGVICGSSEYPGAAVLACEGGLRTGVGMLRYFGERENVSLVLATRPEVVCHKIPSLQKMTRRVAEKMIEKADGVTAYLVGCGCGKSVGLSYLLEYLFETDGAPLILDADALNVIADPRFHLLGQMKKCQRKIAITPHPAEFSRLSGYTTEYIQKNRLKVAIDFASEYDVVVLLKGSGTIIVTPDSKITVNTRGNTALSKGGSGDVLAGVVASFVAQGLRVDDACALGAYVHGLAGEALSVNIGEAGVLPSDLPLKIAEIIKNIAE